MSSMIDGQGPAAFKHAINVNATGDTEIAIPNAGRYYTVRRFLVTGADADLSGGSLQYGLFSATGGGGEAIVSNGVNSATSLTSATKYVAPTIAQNDYINASSIYFRVGTANGAAATVKVYVFVDYLPSVNVTVT